MKAQQYQRGSLALRRRQRQPDLWEFRFYTEERGRTVYRRQPVGSVVDFPTRKDAEKAVAQLRVKINDGAAFAPITIEQLVDHYKLHELPENHSFSTMAGYTNILDTQVIPTWGACSLSEIKSMNVEKWLRGLKRKHGKPASPAYRSKIRNLMSALFSHAIRNEWAVTNPITAVRTSAKRLRTPDILAPEEFRALLGELDLRERVLLLLVGATGLRRGELIALRWSDLDFDNLLVNVTHSVWHSVEGRHKNRGVSKTSSIAAASRGRIGEVENGIYLPLRWRLRVRIGLEEGKTALAAGDDPAATHKACVGTFARRQENRLALLSPWTRNAPQAERS